MKQSKKEFVNIIFLSDSYNSAVRTRNQEGKIFESANSEKRTKFQDDCYKLLHQYAQSFKTDPWTFEDHYKKIEEFRNEVTDQGNGILKNNTFRYGIAQKMLNLYFKYLWCSGDLKTEPLHCPIDGIVKEILGNSTLVNWTSMVEMEEYKKYIDLIREKDKSRSPSQWELEEWGTYRKSKRSKY